MDEDKRVEGAGKPSCLDDNHHGGDEESTIGTVSAKTVSSSCHLDQKEDTFEDQEPDECANSAEIGSGSEDYQENSKDGVNNGKLELGLIVTESSSRQRNDINHHGGDEESTIGTVSAKTVTSSCHLDHEEDTFEDQEPGEEIGSGSEDYQENFKDGVNNGKLELGLTVIGSSSCQLDDTSNQRNCQRDSHTVNIEDFIRENHYYVPEDEGKTSTSIAGGASDTESCWMILRSHLESPSDEAKDGNEQDVDSGSESSWVVIEKSDLPSRIQILLAELSRDFYKIVEALKPSDLIILSSSISNTFGGIDDLRDAIQKIRSGDITPEAMSRTVSAAQRMVEGIIEMIEGGRSLMPVVRRLMIFVFNGATNIRETLIAEVAARYSDRRTSDSSSTTAADASANTNSSTDSQSADTDDTKISSTAGS